MGRYDGDGYECIEWGCTAVVDHSGDKCKAHS